MPQALRLGFKHDGSVHQRITVGITRAMAG